jgi:outer membrane protein
MRSHIAVLTAFLAGVIPAGVFAQAPAAPQPTPEAPVAAPASKAVAPTAYPAKIALIAFEQAVISTNEGQRTLADVQKKYEPQKTKIEALATDIDNLKKQLQSAPAGQTDEQRAAKLKEIDAKDKQLQNETEDATNAYNAEVQQALSKVMQKVSVVMQDYLKKNGYTLLLDVSGEQNPVMWAANEPNSNITQAVVDAYNASSGIAPPPPAAPTPNAPKPPAASAPKAPAPAPKTTPATK